MIMNILSQADNVMEDKKVEVDKQDSGHLYKIAEDILENLYYSSYQSKKKKKKKKDYFFKYHTMICKKIRAGYDVAQK